MKTVERILVPLDHSPGSDAVVEFACTIARGASSALTLLHVYEPPNGMVGIVVGASVAGEIAAEQLAGASVLDRGAAIVHANGLPSVDRILERAASPSAAIAAHARVGKFDLIVMGSHARAGLSRVVLGSVAADVLRASPCPVLMVHLPEG